jgi:Bax protein
MLNLLASTKVPALLRVLFLLSFIMLTAVTFTDRRSESVISHVLDLHQLPVPAPDESSDPLVGLSMLPNFDAYNDVDARKEAFFGFLSSYVEQENARISEAREVLEPLYAVAAKGLPLSRPEQAMLHEIAREYRLDPDKMDNFDLLSELMLRVDIIPTSLVLAQAANESGWGTSRFAREGNNIFGQWCFDEGCGLVPERRANNASHEVRAFDSVESSVKAYFRNINTNRSYAFLRELRADMCAQGEPLNSLVLAHGLSRYSERGHAYVSELQSIIRFNGLSNLDDQS